MARARLRWSLSTITIAIFFGFLVLISEAPALLGTNIGYSQIPLGIPLALGVIVSVVLLTGYYVYRSNMHFDRLVGAIQREVGQ